MAGVEACQVGQRFIPSGQFTYAQIPNVLLKYTGLTSTEKLIWARLCQYAGKNGECYPSYTRLAAEVGVARRSAIRAVEKLVKDGFLEKESSSRSGGRNRYYFIFHPVFKDEDRCQNVANAQAGECQVVTTPGDKMSSRQCQSDPPAGDNPSPKIDNNKINKKEEKTSAGAVSSSNSYDHPWLEFATGYISKIQWEVVSIIELFPDQKKEDLHQAIFEAFVQQPDGRPLVPRPSAMMAALRKIKYRGCSAYRNGYDPFPTIGETIIAGYWSEYQNIDGRKSEKLGQAEKETARNAGLPENLADLLAGSKPSKSMEPTYQDVMDGILDNDSFQNAAWDVWEKTWKAQPSYHRRPYIPLKEVPRYGRVINA